MRPALPGIRKKIFVAAFLSAAALLWYERRAPRMSLDKFIRNIRISQLKPLKVWYPETKIANAVVDSGYWVYMKRLPRVSGKISGNDRILIGAVVKEFAPESSGPVYLPYSYLPFAKKVPIDRLTIISCSIAPVNEVAAAQKILETKPFDAGGFARVPLSREQKLFLRLYFWPTNSRVGMALRMNLKPVRSWHNIVYGDHGKSLQIVVRTEITEIEYYFFLKK